VWEGLGDLPDHRVGAGDGDLVLGHALGDRLPNRLAAEVPDAGAVLDQLDLLGRLDHPVPHRRCGDVGERPRRQGVGDLAAQVCADVVVLDAEPPAMKALTLEDLLHGIQIVVAAPVGVDDVRSLAAPPRHARIDVRRDRGGVALRHNEEVVASEGGAEEVGVVVDVVVARQEHRVQAFVGHVLAQVGQPALHLDRGEGRHDLLAVRDVLEAFEVHGGSSSRVNGMMRSVVSSAFLVSWAKTFTLLSCTVVARYATGVLVLRR